MAYFRIQFSGTLGGMDEVYYMEAEDECEVEASEQYIKWSEDFDDYVDQWVEEDDYEDEDDYIDALQVHVSIDEIYPEEWEEAHKI